MDTFCWLISNRHKRGSCLIFCNDSEEEGLEIGKVLGVPCRPGDSLELILSSSMCHECEFCGLDSDEDGCLSLVSVVSSLVVASCDSAWCVEECCRSHFSVHNDQCSQLSNDHSLNVSINVELKEQPKICAGSWQDWSDWKTGDRSWSEGVWNKKRDTFVGTKNFVRKERSEGVIDVEVTGKTPESCKKVHGMKKKDQQLGSCTVSDGDTSVLSWRNHRR